LLAEGDIIALQIGDIAPADCVQVAPPSSSTRHAMLRVKAGDLLSLESLRLSSDEIISQLPAGRSTLPPGSDHLLTLCNGMIIFMVEKAPLHEFIRHSSGKPNGAILGEPGTIHFID
jgi:hypothetical protein